MIRTISVVRLAGRGKSVQPPANKMLGIKEDTLDKSNNITINKYFKKSKLVKVSLSKLFFSKQTKLKLFIIQLVLYITFNKKKFKKE